MTDPTEASDGGFWGDGVDAPPGEANRRFRALFRAIDDGVFQLDESGRFVAVNDGLLELTGHDRDDLAGEHAARVFEAYDRIEREGRRWEDEPGIEDERSDVLATPLRRSDGRVVDCEIRLTPLFENGGRKTVGVVREVERGSDSRSVPELARSARKGTDAVDGGRAEAEAEATATATGRARAKAEAELEEGYGRVTDGFVAVDEAWEFTHVNERAEEIFGVDEHRLLGTTIWDQFPALVDTVFEERYREAMDRGKQLSLEAYYEPLDTWFREHLYPSGSGLSIYFRDSTERKEMEAELRERERQLSTLMDNVPGVVYRCANERGWPMEFVGDACADITGYDPEAIESGEVSYGDDVILETSRDELWVSIQETVVDREPFSKTYRIETADGEVRWVRDYGRGVFEDGELVALEGILIDVTERKRLETELEEVFGRVTDAFYALDERWQFTHLNDRAEQLIDFTEDGLIGKNVWETFEWAADSKLREEYEQAMESQESTAFEIYYPEPLETWFEVNAYPSETGLSVYFRDISDRKAQERELEESERRYRALADYFPNGIVALFDHELEYTLAAGQGFDVTPVDPADIEGTHFREAWNQETADALEPAFEAALEGEERAVELEYAGREWIVRGVPITDERGEVFAGMTMAQDITEQKERERKLEEVVDRLEESNERLEQFAYAASHDLQEPLRMVSSYLQLLESRYGDDLDEDGEEFLAFAVDGADRMKAMIQGLLEYSRVESRGDPFEPVDLEAVLTAAKRDLRMRVAEADAEIDAGPLPVVEGDADQLRQVFQNLLDNAVEYSGDGPPRIEVSARRVDASVGADVDDCTWVVSVSDDGIGIAPADQERIFEVFNRLHSRDEHPGTGIGLSLCERIVERHGGEIWVDSEPGEGTTVSFTLPAVDAEQ